MSNKTCKECGKPFESVRASKEFCSEACNARYRRRGGPPVIIETNAPSDPTEYFAKSGITGDYILKGPGHMGQLEGAPPGEKKYVHDLQDDGSISLIEAGKVEKVVQAIKDFNEKAPAALDAIEAMKHGVPLSPEDFRRQYPITYAGAFDEKEYRDMVKKGLVKTAPKYFGKVDPPVTKVTPKGELKKEPSDQAEARRADVARELNARFGPGTIMRLGDKPLEGIDVISTGSRALNAALGIGGVPRKRMVEIFGPESSGKTTLALHIIAEAQKAGLGAAFIDAEHAFDRDYALAIGVDVEGMYLAQPDNGEQALEIADSLISSKQYGVVVIDSVAALVPKSELEGEMGDSKMGLHARLMSQACRKLTAVVSKSDTTLVWINQLRSKIGVMWGSPETTTGGKALAYYCSVRLDVRNLGKEGTPGDYTGNKTKVTVAKNKCAPPFRVAEFGIVYGEGIDRMGELLDMASEAGVLKKSGSWYAYKESKIGNGRAACREILKDNLELVEQIENDLNLKIKAK